MTDAEKLQKLIEMAWENGWQGFSPEIFEIEYHYYKGSDNFCLIEKNYAPGNEPEVYQINTIIFDHEFIKALCKAKYGVRTHVGNAPLWGERIKELAVSTNRIDYLYEIFCEY